MFLAYVCPGYSTKISASPGAASVTSTVAGGACAETFCSPLEPQPVRAASSAIGKTPDAVDNFICHPPECAYYQTVNWTSGFADRIQAKRDEGASVCNDTDWQSYSGQSFYSQNRSTPACVGMPPADACTVTA